MRGALLGTAVGALGAGLLLVASCSLVGSGTASDAGGDVVLPDTGTPDNFVGMDAGPDADQDAPSDADATPDVPILPLAPNEISGLRLWLRDNVVLGDAGTDGGQVIEWSDQADAGPPRNVVSTGSSTPVRETAVASYGNRDVVSFATNGEQRLQNVSVNIPQPLTILVVGQASTDTSYFIDSTVLANRLSLLTLTGKKLALVTSSGSYAPSLGGPVVDQPTIIVAVFNQAQSALYASSDTGLVNLNPGTNGLAGITVGSYQGGLYGLGGRIAEVAVWNVAFDPMTVRRLNRYASARYGIALK